MTTMTLMGRTGVPARPTTRLARALRNSHAYQPMSSTTDPIPLKTANCDTVLDAIRRDMQSVAVRALRVKPTSETEQYR